MIYFDHSANTPVDNDVLNAFVEATKKYTANPNSSHHLGKLAKEQIDNTSAFIADYFNCNSDGIIYTNSATESNNLAIKGIADKYKNKGYHIIISAMEHSSIVAPCNFLSSFGFDVSVISTNKNGTVNLEELKNIVTDKTILVSICAVDSELCIIQPIEEIGNIVKNYENCVFHTDATQAIGKFKINASGKLSNNVFTSNSQIVDNSDQNVPSINFSNVDFVTFTPHKFYGLNGLGILVNRANIPITPLLHGGKSTTIYRSGSPDTANIISAKVALEKSLSTLSTTYSYVSTLNNILRDGLSKYEYVHINSPINASPYILNFSLINKDTNTIIKELNEHKIYVSRGSACSLDNRTSRATLSLTGNEDLSNNTIRISLSHLNTKDEIEEFFKVFELVISEK